MPPTDAELLELLRRLADGEIAPDFLAGAVWEDGTRSTEADLWNIIGTVLHLRRRRRTRHNGTRT